MAKRVQSENPSARKIAVRPTYERVRDLLDYEPATGLFRWRLTRPGKGGRILAGTVAGHRGPRSYIEIRIDGYLVDAHRLAWLWMTGTWPREEIDHRNSDRGDTRWANLRPATHGQNGAFKGPNKNNRLGVKGVRIDNRGKIEARIWKTNKTVSLGYFSSIDEASHAYEEEARKLRGEFAWVRTSSRRKEP
jgi:hypothetical protein